MQPQSDAGIHGTDEPDGSVDSQHNQPVVHNQETPTAQDTLSSDFKEALLEPHPTGAAAARRPPSVPLAPMKRMQARFNPLADIMMYVVVFVGGAFGTAMRYAIWLWLPYTGTDDPVWMAFHPATFIANMISTFIFAVVSSYITQAVWMHKRAKQLISRGVGMGMCGGFSTLSAMMIEDITAMHAGGYLSFFIYTMLSFLCGCAIAWLGSWIGLQLTKRRSQEAVAAAMASRNTAKPAIGVRVPVDPAVIDDPKVSEQISEHIESSSLGSLALRPIANEPDVDTNEIPIVGDPVTGEIK